VAELEAVGGELKEGLLEGGELRRELVQDQRGRCCELADPGGRHASHDQDRSLSGRPGIGVIGLGQHSLAALSSDEVGQAVGIWRAHPYGLAGPAADHFLGGSVGEEPASADNDQVIGSDCHLVHQVAGDQHRLALAGQVLHQVPDP
jgi:hypothetical protein